MDAVFHKNFKKKFKKLPPKIQEKFYERLDVFLQNKFDTVLNNHSVDKVFLHCRSINVSGDYRAIFRDQKDVVIFITIGTHSDLYY